jgi:hypothetical protein
MLAAALCSVGCSSQPRGSASEPKIKTLLSSTDVVLIKHFYPAMTLTERPDPKYPHDILPGVVSIKAAWIYRPDNQGNGEKGASVHVLESRFYGTGGVLNGGREGSAWLDLDELQDLSAALSYYMEQNSPWRAAAKNDHIEANFVSKDRFEASAFEGSDGRDSLYIEAAGVSADLAFDDAAKLKQIVDDEISLLKMK